MRRGLNQALLEDIKPRTEPQIYKPRERIIYNPEVKQLLQRIESHLKPDAKQMLKQLEENPELYDEISDKLLAKMNENLKKQLKTIKRMMR